MIPGSKGHKPRCACTKVVLCLYDPPQHEDKSGAYAPRYPNMGQNCESAQHETIR